MIYWQLFLCFLQIGSLSFGGGYAALPLIENLVVHQNHWLTMGEYTDLITISQMTPGPIAINSATFIGIKVAGLAGAMVATLGSVLPSIIIVSILARIYTKYQELDLMQNVLLVLRPTVVALIASSGLSILISALWSSSKIGLATISWPMVFIFITALILLNKFKLNPILVMILSGLLNILLSFFL